MKISEKGKIEEMLYAYAEKNETAVDEEKIRETVKRSREAFLQVKRRGRPPIWNAFSSRADL